MDASRSRFRSLVEWMLAAAVTAAIVLAGAFVVRAVRTIQAAVPAAAAAPSAAPTDVPAGVPPRTVSLPMLLLPDGTAIRVGDRETTVARRLGDTADVTSETLDRRGARDRVTRTYASTGMQFVLVFEAPAEAPGEEPRVAGIYLQ